MSEELLNSIDSKLDILIKLVATTAVRDKPLGEGGPLLAACGLDRNTIAEIYNTTPNSVSVQKSVAKKRKNQRQVDRGDQR
jgi:hypothetical protein